MNKMIPLKDLIAQLQEIENSSPGINCVVMDSEVGMDSPKVTCNNVFLGIDEHLYMLDEEGYKSLCSLVESYENKSTLEMWNELDDESKSLGTFEQFDKDIQIVLEDSRKRIESYKRGEMCVVLSI